MEIYIFHRKFAKNVFLSTNYNIFRTHYALICPPNPVFQYFFQVFTFPFHKTINLPNIMHNTHHQKFHIYFFLPPQKKLFKSHILFHLAKNRFCRIHSAQIQFPPSSVPKLIYIIQFSHILS